jgi:transposase
MRSLAAPSLLAHVVSDKFCDGLPRHRQKDRVSHLGMRIDRGTMSRCLEDLGMTLGATVVRAMHGDAFAWFRRARMAYPSRKAHRA